MKLAEFTNSLGNLFDNVAGFGSDLLTTAGNLKDQYLALVEIENDTVEEKPVVVEEKNNFDGVKDAILGGAGLLVGGMLIVKVLK